MSSEISATAQEKDPSSDTNTPLVSPKHVSKSLQNIQSECHNSSKPPQNVDSKSHRRSHSQSLSPQSPLEQFHRSLSYQPGAAEKVIKMEDGEIFHRDSSQNYEDVHGGRSGKAADVPCFRLVIVSSKVRNISSIRHSLLPGVILIQYNCDTQNLDDLEVQIAQVLNGKKVQGTAFILSCSGSSLQLVIKEDKILSKDGNLEKGVQDFFSRLVKNYFLPEDSKSRIDFFGWHGLQNSDSLPPVVSELQLLTGVTVGVWRDLTGYSSPQRKSDESASKPYMGELYFRLEKLRNWSGRHQQSLAGFEKIRIVGKGAYGAAVLYKKKDDESLVILKEINMHDLNVNERQLALNEVSVLAMLDHPNIISYYDSFEEDGVLMIEMEYADNGTLAQFLSKQDRPLEEREILLMFQQIVAAIRHIHSHNILHRDLKTDNIFLTKEGVVKIGDFGISKMMGSANKGAETVLGTPYYISPEMCEGKLYSFKSDIWALGCILYEMACFQKTFEGSNLPALVNKIMKGQFAPVKGNYSEEFKEIVTDMLRRSPEDRPEANTIMYQRLPSLMNKFDKAKSDQEDDTTSSESLGKKTKIRSVLYYLECSTATLTCIYNLPPRMKIKHMSVGPDHVIVTTTERQVFTWGFGGSGQLGHGDTRDRYTPTLVEALKGKSVSLVSCGLGFSIFGSDNGLVLTCGDGSSGCLGHGDWCNSARPRLIESLLSVDVVAIACGLKHVVVLGRDGEVMSWGNGSHGQLGLGSEESQCVPTTVQIGEESVVFNDVECGVDGTMLISDVGGVFACGNNEHNKLGLNNRQGFLMAMKNIFTKTEVDGKNVPTPVRALARHRVLAVSMGRNHTAVIVEPGHVITFGRNLEGQLGTQNVKPASNPVEVKALEEKCVNRVQCGDHFTVAGTKDHELYYWGLRYTSSPMLHYEDTTSQSSTNDSITCIQHPNNKEELHIEGACSHVSNSNGMPASDKDLIKNRIFDSSGKETVENSPPSVFNDVDSQGFRPLSSVPQRSLSASSQENSKDKDREFIRDDSVVIAVPKHLILLKQGPEKMLLGNIFCHGENLFIHIETTAPPPRRRTFKKRIMRRKSSHSLGVTSPRHFHNDISSHKEKKTDDNSCSSETSEIDTHSAIPTWLREELAQSAIEVNDGNEADDTSGESDEQRRADGIDSSMSSIQINRALTPVADVNYPPHLTSQTFISGDKCSPRNQNFITQSRFRASSVNSSESNPDALQPELCSDSSSGDISKDQRVKPMKSEGETLKNVLTGYMSTKSQPSKAQGKQRSSAKGRGRGLVMPKENPVGRGFISDVTVKRREESLLFELERIKQEKKLADARVRMLEKEKDNQQALLKQEVEKLASEREQSLISEVERLRLEIETQNCLLSDRQRVVGELQQQLQLMSEQQSTGSGATPRTPRTSRNFSQADDSASSDFCTPRAESSASSSSKKSTTRICNLQ
ncbi:uncharacterized protein LOC101851545 [Aplysia californica]|uniref:non-specific serine/threonine protein kinase n=1 Tax=Aplysia californica TaxID=6500 RepID=A0ABM0ZZJ9_APLCA|nr:uncharacterized protein LOC101851545 [Aplysia californica]